MVWGLRRILPYGAGDDFQARLSAAYLFLPLCCRFAVGLPPVRHASPRHISGSIRYVGPSGEPIFNSSQSPPLHQVRCFPVNEARLQRSLNNVAEREQSNIKLVNKGVDQLEKTQHGARQLVDNCRAQ